MADETTTDQSYWGKKGKQPGCEKGKREANPRIKQRKIQARTTKEKGKQEHSPWIIVRGAGSHTASCGRISKAKARGGPQSETVVRIIGDA